MAVPPLLAAKAAQSAQGGFQKALTGDIYTCKWITVKGKGKKQRVVEHEAHLNPVTAGVGLAATAVGLGLAAWIFQLKLTPTRVNTYATVVDTPEVPAWTSIVEHDAVGHWEHEVVKVGTQTQWIGDTYIRGVFKPGHWITTDKVQDTGRDIWVMDITPYDEKVFHPKIPAVTHQELTGTTKKFSIEQRQPFSMADILPNPLDAIGLGKPVFKPVFGKWAEGQIFARKWW